MTDLTLEAAAAVIASHGADPARWPAADRAALLALAGSDLQVAAALADARRTDAAIADWLGAPLPAMAAIDVAAIVAAPQTAFESGPQSGWTRRIAGWRPALMAASFSMMLVTAGWLALPGTVALPGPDASAPETRTIASLPPSAGASAAEVDLAFAYVFTPTAFEEELI